MSETCAHPDADLVTDRYEPGHHLRLTCCRCGAWGVSDGDPSLIRSQRIAYMRLMAYERSTVDA